MLALGRKESSPRSRAPTGPVQPRPTLSHTASPMLQRATACACGGSCPRCQAKSNLKIGAPDDAHEREADEAADRVMRMADGGVGPVTPAVSGLQRKCSACETEDEEALVQTKAANSSLSARDDLANPPSSVHEVLNSPGRSLPLETRAFFEPRFGHDFTNVRVHNDVAAERSARVVNAKAYTVGHDIVFGAGQYSPHTAHGQRLLAHELTHVLQQNGGTGVGPSLRNETTLQRQEIPGMKTPVGNTEMCPSAPTGLGNTEPDIPCPHASYAGTTELGRFHFCVDSDQVVPGEDLKTIDALVAAQPRSTRFLIHGNASKEGAPGYNLRLACHRANRVGEAVTSAVRNTLTGVPPDHIQPILQDRIQVATRGATAEFGPDFESNRVVVIYAEIPRSGAPDEPECEDAPRHLGEVEPEIPCDPPSMDMTKRSAARDLTHFRFCLDSDVLSEKGPSAVRAFAGKQASTATYVIHGFASSEGEAAYNKRLSCHRALRIARELMNAGVRFEQIREVSGLGETDAFSFGDKKFDAANRTVVVLAEHGNISKLQDSKRNAEKAEDKQAIVDAARTRLLAGQYESAADFYISYWTCGRTPTVRQAVERLSIRVPSDQKNEQIRDQANGAEEDPALGTNAVLVSNTALRADNPVECVMGRLIDMAFHHAVLGDRDLPADLTAPALKRDAFGPPSAPTPRHLAGLHLIALSGLSACKGRHASARVDPARGPAGIDEPLSTDPRSGLPPPACAKSTQPTRLLSPTPGEKNRQAPDFAVFNKSFGLRDGELTAFRLGASEGAFGIAPSMVVTGRDVIQASASVGLIGQPATFGDYEVGFIQTILDDLFIAEYVSGHRVVQKLPFPIRAAHLKGDPPAPTPWMSTSAMVRPNVKGEAQVKSGWRLHTEFGALMNLFRPALPHRDFLDTWQRHTRVAIWLVARRLGAPLDRFSALFLDGAVYEVTENLETEILRVRGDMTVDETSKAHQLDPNRAAPEREMFRFQGRFRTEETSSSPADFREAQFDTPVASDIDAFRQMQKILDPDVPAKTSGLATSEYESVIREILDNLVVFPTEEDANKGTRGTVMPRLGFVFSRLEVIIKVNPKTGRMLPYLNAEDADNPVQVRSPGLGDRARYHIARALALRLEKRDFLKQGRPVVLAAPPPGGVLTFVLDPLMPEPDLSKNSSIRHEMAEMWACSEVTINSPSFLHPKEFAEAYGVDRDRNLVRFPAGKAYFMSSSEDEEKIETNIQCGPSRAGFALGTLHTHPIDDGDSSLPSDTDVQSAKTGRCGRQHYIISKDRVVAYFSDGSQKDLGDRKTLLPKGVNCNQNIPGEVEEF